jgi:hypothetical protein
MFLALLIVPQVAAKQIEGCDFFSVFCIYIILLCISAMDILSCLSLNDFFVIGS